MKINIYPIHSAWMRKSLCDPEERAVPLPGGVRLPISAVEQVQTFPVVKKDTGNTDRSRKKYPVS